MRNAHPKYMCFPSVVCVGKETEVSIVARDISRIFREDREYEMCVVGLRDDQTEYHAHIPLDYPCRVVDGTLRFTYTFDHEQEYSIRFAPKGEKEIKIPLYAVKEDLYELRPLKGDLHGHSYYSDGQDGIHDEVRHHIQIHLPEAYKANQGDDHGNLAVAGTSQCTA